MSLLSLDGDASKVHRLILVRHAESEIPRLGFEDEYTRPLSEKGFKQAEELVSTLRTYAPTTFYSSPYLRAVQTVRPTADIFGIPVEEVEDYREHQMSLVPINNWRDVLRQQWSDFNHVHDDGESMQSTSDRAWQVIESLKEKHLNETIVLAGHGTIISLTLAKLAPEIGFDFHLSVPNPALYYLQFDSEWCWVR